MPVTSIPAVWCSSGSADSGLWYLCPWTWNFGSWSLEKRLARNTSKVLRVFLFSKIFAIISHESRLMYLNSRIKVAEILMIFIKYQSPAINRKFMAALSQERIRKS